MTGKNSAIKKSYKAPTVVRAGSFEELTKAENKFESLMIFGLNGGAANLSATS